jgi:hypothetical protein
MLTSLDTQSRRMRFHIVPCKSRGGISSQVRFQELGEQHPFEDHRSWIAKLAWRWVFCSSLSQPSICSRTWLIWLPCLSPRYNLESLDSSPESRLRKFRRTHKWGSRWAWLVIKNTYWDSLKYLTPKMKTKPQQLLVWATAVLVPSMI